MVVDTYEAVADASTAMRNTSHGLTRVLHTVPRLMRLRHSGRFFRFKHTT